MSNRFTDTMKWDDAFFMDLTPEQKLFWLYVCDKCDHAGVWKVNRRLASVQIGFEVDLNNALEAFGKRIQPLSDEKWHIVGFIEFQYKGQLNPENKAHKGVLAALEKHGIEAPTKGLRRGYEGATKPLPRGLGIGIGEEVGVGIGEGIEKWNPFGILMERFANADPPVIVTQRNGKDVGLINGSGQKMGEVLFRQVSKAYVEDKWTKQGGLSIKGFLNNMDRLANQLRNTEFKEEPKKKVIHWPG